MWTKNSEVDDRERVYVPLVFRVCVCGERKTADEDI